MRLLWICLGGALGTGARYALGNLVLRLAGAGFPFHTLVVNVLGSFLISVVVHVGTTTGALSPTLRAVLVTGVLGGFTTYSSFNHETLAQLERGAVLLGLANVLATVGGCLVAGWLGLVTARAVTGA